MLEYKDWLGACQKLPEGRTERIQHWCGEGEVLVIEHNSEGYRGYCHRCHTNGFKAHGRQSVDLQLKRWSEADADLQKETHRKEIKLPKDLTEVFPVDAVMWLSRGGITTQLAKRYSIKYSPSYARVFLPVYQDSALVYWQARAVHKGQKPKYINPAIDKGSIRFESDTRCERVVVTEDVLSAVKVGDNTGYTGLSILGTTASPSDLLYICGFKEIILWFDPDDAGRACTSNITRSLELLGRNCRVIRSTRDPKEYSRRKLAAILNS